MGVHLNSSTSMHSAVWLDASSRQHKSFRKLVMGSQNQMVLEVSLSVMVTRPSVVSKFISRMLEYLH